LFRCSFGRRDGALANDDETEFTLGVLRTCKAPLFTLAFARMGVGPRLDLVGEPGREPERGLVGAEAV
jgi:hypothetical protein